jgi:hypothetical protein
MGADEIPDVALVLNHQNLQARRILVNHGERPDYGQFLDPWPFVTVF